MKQLTTVLFLILSVSLLGQFNGGTYNNILNLGDMSSLEVVPGTKMDKAEKMADDLVGNLFGSMGVNTKTNENPIVKISAWMPNDGHVWRFYKVNDGEYVIFNDTYKLALGVEGAKKDDKAKIIPMAYKENDPNQIFVLERDTLTYRYGSFWKNKNSGLVVEIDPKSKELFQTQKVEGNKNQVWAICYRRKLMNKETGGFLAPQRSTALFAGAPIEFTPDAKSIYTNWDMVSLPGSTGWYYMMNVMSKKFMVMEKDENGRAKVGSPIVQGPYNRDKVMLFGLNSTNDEEYPYFLLPNPSENTFMTGSGNNFTGAPVDSTNAGQHWKLVNGTFSLF